MAGEGKTIKIAFAVDEQSAKRAKTLIDDLTRSVEKLVTATSRAGSAMSGVGGTTVTGRKTLPGLGGISHMSTPAGRGQGGIVGSILGVQDATALRGLVTGTQQAFNAIQANIKTFVDRAESDLKRLQRAVEQLGGSMGKVAPAAAGGGGGAPPPPAPPGAPPPARPPGGKPNTQQGVERFMGGVESLLRGDVTGFLGSTAGRAGMVGGAAYAGFRVGDALNEAMMNERLARVNQTLNQPFDTLNRRAQIAQPFLRMHAAVQQRDVAMQQAYMSTLKDPEIMKSLGKVQLRAEALEHTKFKTATAKGAIKEAFNDFRNWVGAKTGVTTDDAFTYIQGLPADEVTKNTMRDIVRQNAVANLDPQAAAQFQQAVEAKRALQDPTTAMLLNQVYGGAMGRVQSLRAAGMSTAVITRRDESGREYQTSRYEDMEQRLMRGGWTIGDYAAGRHQMLGVGAGYMKALGPIGVISAGIGGLGNAAELTKMGGILGGGVGAAGDFYRTVQRNIGSGGLDVATGRDLFHSFGQHAMQSGQFGAGNTASHWMQNIAALVGGGPGTPFDVAEQQRRMMMVQSGLANNASFMQGSKAPLYQATSLMGAISASGGYGAGAEALRKLDPGVLQSIASGGEVPEYLKGLLGNSPEEAKMRARDALAYNRKAPFFEIMDDQFAGTGEKETLLKELRSAEAGGGDVKSLIERRTAGLKGRAKEIETERLAQQFGGILFAGGLAASGEEGAGTVLSMFGSDARRLKGGGVGAAGAAGAEAASLNREADLTQRHGELMVKMEGLIKALAPATALEKNAEAGIKSLGSMGAGLPGSVGTLIAALEQFRAEVQKSTKNVPQKVK